MDNPVDTFKQLSDLVHKKSGQVNSEEDTKRVLVMPFIKTLGYDPEDEVKGEFSADTPGKKGEKVDYAIFKRGKPIILIECKIAGTDLTTAHAEQLRRYFHNTDAPFGILTNGVEYRFFTDLVKRNVMDVDPFMTIDIRHLDETTIKHLKRFTRQTFNEEKIHSMAEGFKRKTDELKSKVKELEDRRQRVRTALEKELKNPSENFVKFFVAQIHKGRATPVIKKEYSELIKSELDTLIIQQGGKIQKR